MAAIVAAVALGMIGLSYAAVPLYKMFCQETGFAGTPIRGSRDARRAGLRHFEVRFDTNVASDLPWSLEPETPSVDVTTGKTTTVFFRVRNQSAQATTGQASFNVSPDVAGAYFVKLACFCFSTQRLGPGESAEWPVVFYVDPAVETDETMQAVETLTLSYTMFGTRGTQPPFAETPPPRHS